MVQVVLTRMAEITLFLEIRAKFAMVLIWRGFTRKQLRSGFGIKIWLRSLGTVSSQWYPWTMSNYQCKLCHNCWTYWKRYGGFKSPSKLCEYYLYSARELIFGRADNLTAWCFYPQVKMKWKR